MQGASRLQSRRTCPILADRERWDRDFLPDSCRSGIRWHAILLAPILAYHRKGWLDAAEIWAVGTVREPPILQTLL